MNFPIESQLLSTILTPKTSGNKNNTTKYTYTPKTGREATAIPRNIHILQKQAKKQKPTMVIQRIVGKSKIVTEADNAECYSFGDR